MQVESVWYAWPLQHAAAVSNVFISFAECVLVTLPPEHMHIHSRLGYHATLIVILEVIFHICTRMPFVCSEVEGFFSPSNQHFAEVKCRRNVHTLVPIIKLSVEKIYISFGGILADLCITIS